MLRPFFWPPSAWNSNWHIFRGANNGGERFQVTQCTLQLACDREKRWPSGKGGGGSGLMCNVKGVGNDKLMYIEEGMPLM